ncbi:MAG: stage IV sporulation protein A [Lachnospiraceae bacterium]|nr:stage IV sporulation protein A [Lachnospiraceae bacterium]
MDNFDLYRDIRMRTNGEIYVGIVGPVRTGKSTFARKFMEQLVLPELKGHNRIAARDEMPTSASGKMVTTVEPKFIPREAALVPTGDGSTMAVRLVDCVGFPVPGAEGMEEDGKSRMVKTPWQEQPMPFEEAARMGTRKVILEHATVGLAITSDGSFGELPRESFLEAEKETILSLKQIGKPFLVIVNSASPYSERAGNAVSQITAAYGVRALSLNCEQIGPKEIRQVFEQLLPEFPLTRVIFQIPKWVETLSPDHWLKQSLFTLAKSAMQGLHTLGDVTRAVNEKTSPKESGGHSGHMEIPATEIRSSKTAERALFQDNSYVRRAKLDHVDYALGSAEILVSLKESLYYEILSEMTGADIRSEYQLISLVNEMSSKKAEYEAVSEALEAVRRTGYGVISPRREEIQIEEPTVIRQGNRFGVKITAKAPSIHLLRADVVTEVAPVVGSEEQAKDLISYMKQNENTDEGIYQTLIFGKSVEQLVDDGIRSKLYSVNEECQVKLQNAMKRIVNESKGRIIFILL